MSGLNDFLIWLNGNVFWGPPMIFLLLSTGIYISFRTRFFQLRHFGLILKKTVGCLFGDKKQNVKGAVSPLQAVSTALASTIGIGNIVGVASAITMGGAGAVFWMWVSAFFGMMTAYSENLLGIYYRKISKNGELIGGPMYYIKEGLKGKRFLKYLRKPLAILFAFFCLLASLGMGNMTQVNTVAVIFGEGVCGIKIPPIAVGVVVSLLTASAIFGGVDRICRLAEKTVPLMAGLYIFGCLAVVLLNFNSMGFVLKSIFLGAFGIKSAFGGVAGHLIIRGVEMGLRRGVFSNEAGLGSSVIVGALSSVKEPAEQGMWGVFTVFFDTIIGCSLTAFAILSSGAVADLKGELGAVTVVAAFSKSLGTFAGRAVAALTVFFALSTLLGWSVYGIRCAEYLLGERGARLYKPIYVLTVIAGAVMKLETVWLFADAFNGLMAVPNLIAVLALSNKVIAITQNYIARIVGGKDYLPPCYSTYPDIQQMTEVAE